MPPLRYRFWLTETKEMSPVFGMGEEAGWFPRLTQDKDGIVAQIDLCKEYIRASVIPMQSTGLKDCKSVEIFQDDIVRGSDGVCVRIIWERGSFVFSGRGVRGGFDAEVSLWLAHPESVEVIGNVHANPSLLQAHD